MEVERCEVSVLWRLLGCVVASLGCVTVGICAMSSVA